MSFKSMKKSSTKDLAKLTEQLEKQNTKSDRADQEGFWKLTVDKAGNGHAVIRFLPAVPKEDIPWVRIWDHGFQGPGGQWYIENSLTTLGKKDPCSEHNSALWNSGADSDKDIARKQKRRLAHISNILVVSDPGNPENNGKVFLFKYGAKIFDHLNGVMNPEFDDQVASNPFDLWTGSNFKLRARKVEGYRNYDKSAFEDASAICDDDEKLEEIYNSQRPLQSFVSLDKFKSYEELRARLVIVLQLEEPESQNETAPTPNTPSDDSAPLKSADEVPLDETDDDSLEYFASLAEED